MSPPGYVTFLSLRLSCHAGVVVHRYHSLVGSFASALEACMAPSGTMKTSSRVGGIQVVSRSGLMGLVSEALGVFSNWDLTFYFYGPTKGSNNNL